MGVAVYTPGLSRQCKLELNKKGGIDFHSGKLRVQYTLPDEEGSAILAEAELLLN